jgi:hypothetical protein
MRGMRRGGFVLGRGITNGGPIGAGIVSGGMGGDSAGAWYRRLCVCRRISSSQVRMILRSVGLFGLRYCPT